MFLSNWLRWTVSNTFQRQSMNFPGLCLPCQILFLKRAPTAYNVTLSKMVIMKTVSDRDTQFKVGSEL